MHLKGMLGLCGAIVAAIALVSASGATTTKTHKIARIDVSSRAAIVHYLRSHHMNTKGLVIQRGLRNYAGPRCPGQGWRCARTLHTVVQIARPGGKNRFWCSAARCAVLQVAAAPSRGSNGVCIRATGLTQSCTINQSGAGPNSAVVYENAETQSGLTQTASSTALITQVATGTAASNGNTACVTQNVKLTGSTTAKRGTPVTVQLEAHQSVTINQDVAGAGTNNAVNGATSSGTCDTTTLGQNQTLNSIANGSGPITQSEDAAFSGCGDLVPGDYANLCLDIEQNRGSVGLNHASGPNNATFTQTSSQKAIANTSTNTGSVTQTQSSTCSDPNAPADCQEPGGLVGTVNQYSTGVSTANATQTETQCEDAATSGLTECHTAPGDGDFNGAYQLTQNQYGPVGVGKLRHRQRGRQVYGHLKGLGTATQTGGNSGDRFTINQTSTQDNDQGSGGSTSNQTNIGQADCSTPGNCDSHQTTTVNGSTTRDTQSGQDINSSINCTGSDCTATPPGSPNVLIAGTGDPEEAGTGQPNDDLAQALTAAGYSVTESPTLPADLSSFGQVWWVDTNPPSTDEQNQLVAFEESGRGVFLTGEWSDPETESGFLALDAADQSMVNSIVTAGGITLGGEGCCSGTPVAYPVNSGVVGNLATVPHTVTSWTPTFPGLISGMAASSVFAYYQPDPTQVAAAAWDRSSTVGNGRLVLFMDINWAEAAWRAPNWSDVAENVAFFLSSPASPPVLQAPITGLSLLGPQAQTAPARTTTPTASGRSSSDTR
jgi:hypothetical protein